MAILNARQHRALRKRAKLDYRIYYRNILTKSQRSEAMFRRQGLDRNNVTYAEANDSPEISITSAFHTNSFMAQALHSPTMLSESNIFVSKQKFYYTSVKFSVDVPLNTTHFTSFKVGKQKTCCGLDNSLAYLDEIIKQMDAIKMERVAGYGVVKKLLQEKISKLGDKDEHYKLMHTKNIEKTRQECIDVCYAVRENKRAVYRKQLELINNVLAATRALMTETEYRINYYFEHVFLCYYREMKRLHKNNSSFIRYIAPDYALLRNSFFESSNSDDFHGVERELYEITKNIEEEMTILTTQVENEMKELLD